jgi:trigger factor
MQITIEDISPVEKRVEFEVPWTDVAPRLDRAYTTLRRDVRLKGFRPGKAPRPVLEKLYKQDVENDVARELIEASIGQAIRENQLEPVAPPRVDKLELRAGAPFKFSARVEVRSHVDPTDYKNIPLKRRPATVTDEQIDQALETYRRQLTEFVPVEGRAETAETDIAVIDVSGKVGEHKVKKNTVMVDLAEEKGGPLPGLGPKLRGLTVGGEQPHDIKYRIPDDVAQRELAGKEVSLRVVIKELRLRKTPALDDEFAKDTGEADTLADLKAKIRERLLEQDRQRIKREMSAELVKELVARHPFAIAPALVDRHAEAIVYRAKYQLAMMGVDVESGAVDEAKMKKDFAAEAEQEARGTIIVRAIAAKEGIQASDADLQKRIAELAAARQESAKRLRSELEQNGQMEGLRAQIVEEKALDMLLAQAKISDVDPDRLIVTPDEAAAAGSGRLVLTPEEAAAEAARARKNP